MVIMSGSMLPPSVYFIDFEAFQHGDEDFNVKELCIIYVAKPNKQLYYLYLPPCLWNSLTREQQRTYQYANRDIHKLSLDEGYVRFCTECLQRDMDRFLFTTSNRELSVFFVMGRQKTKFLQRMLPDYKFINYQDAFGVRSSRHLPEAPECVRCMHRVHGKHCAVLKCFRMYMHFMSS